MKNNKQDYKINFNNIHYLIIHWIVYIVISIVLVIGASMMYINDAKHYATITSDDYNYVITSNGVPSKKNVYYRVNNLSSVITQDNKTRSVYMYMEKADSVYDQSPLLTKKLGKNEVAISSKIAGELHLGVGDEVRLDISIYEEPVKYKIACLLDYVYEYFDYEDKSSLSVVKIGYDENIEHAMSGVYMGFYNDAEYEEFMSNNEPYVLIKYVSYEKKRMNTRLIVMDIVSGILFLVAFSVFACMMMKAINTEAGMLFIDGYRDRRLRNIILFDQLILLVLPSLILDLFFVVMMCVGVLPSITALIDIIIPSIVLVVLLLNRGRKYGKAN